MTKQEMPGRIWLTTTESGYVDEFTKWTDIAPPRGALWGQNAEYRRADVPPTPAEAMRCPEVAALVEAARKTRGEIDRWVAVKGSTYDQLSAAITALEQEARHG